MVSEGLIGAVVGGSAGILGAGITALFSWLTTVKRVESENKRHRAEFYWEKEAEALTKLHEKLEECHRRIMEYQNPHADINRIPSGEHEEEILPVIEEFRIAIRREGIYLSEDTHDALIDVLGQFYHSTESIDWGIDPEDSDKELKELDRLSDKYDKAKEALSKQLNEPIELVD